MKAEVDPLPFVPAMWTGFKRFNSRGCLDIQTLADNLIDFLKLRDKA